MAKRNMEAGKEPEKIVLTVKEAADMIGVSAATIRCVCRDGKVKYVEFGNRWLVNRKSLLRYFGEDV